MEDVMAVDFKNNLAEGLASMSQAQRNILGGETYRFIRRALRDPDIRAKVDTIIQSKNNAGNAHSC